MRKKTSQNGVDVSKILSKIKIRRKLLESVTTKIEDEGKKTFWMKLSFAIIIMHITKFSTFICRVRRKKMKE